MLRSIRDFETFVVSGVRGKATGELVLDSYDRETLAGSLSPRQLMVGVVEACRGLRAVCVGGLTVDWELLYSPNMAGGILHRRCSWLAADPPAPGVTSLFLCGLAHSYPLSSSPLLFHLTHLQLRRTPDSPFLDLLLQPTITSLSFNPTTTTSTHIPSLTSIAPQLANVHMPSWSSVTAFKPFFLACDHLSRLSCDLDRALFALPLLPTDLKSLEVGTEMVGEESDGLQALLELLRTNVAALSGLRKLELLADDEGMQYMAHTRELLSECEERGILVEITVDTARERG